MSTNTNPSNGASKKPLKTEMVVKKVDDEEIIKDIKKYTGNENTIITADCVLCEVGEMNYEKAGTPVGSNVSITAQGRQSTEEIEKGNSVTIQTRNTPVAGKDSKDTKKDAATKRAEEAKKAEDKAKSGR